ncbi:hypothetical protein AB0L65_31970 [Nonomuraea sp. NPDC052116]|uniref:hypothetical protein n=1 Tax=Nonomuraea sp. NPDC052116 TaxID=3155665 RepID=UPI00342C7619
MRVELHSQLFAGSDHVSEIHELIQLFLRRQHEWVIDPRHAESAADFFGRHFPTLAPGYSDLAVKASVAQAWRATGEDALFISAATIRDDVCDLRQPAILLVEDEFSDRCFLLAICHVLDGADVSEAVERQHLDIRHGGGKDRAGKQAAEAAGRFKRTPRVALLLDSDRLAPGQTTRCHKIANEVHMLGVQVHVLELREAENYAPNRVLATVRPYHETSKKIAALKSFDAAQRGYFDMKKGFHGRGGRGAGVPAGHAGLYDGVSERTINVLRTGFGDGLTELMLHNAAGRRLTEPDFAGLGAGVAAELRELLGKLRKVI